ncbi:MAG: hypothetical protein H7Y32_06960, partial [Chloroflexales bacterium]|nr:hypothetical protein [Chloroflexales bacterium]
MHITRRELHIGPHMLASDQDDKGAAPYLLSGPHLYVIGRGSGAIAPLPSQHHIPNEMGGIWAHPLKVAEGMLATVCDAAGAPIEAADASFEERL